MLDRRNKSEHHHPDGGGESALNGSIGCHRPQAKTDIAPSATRESVTMLRLVVGDQDAFRVPGLQWTFLRPGIFAANALGWWAPRIRAGDIVRWPYLAVPTAPIHERDIAAVAAHALCDSRHAGADYVLTSPESLTQFDQLSTIGRATGQSLRIEEISPEEARRELLPLMPLPVINILLDAWAAAVGQPALVTSTVAAITGTPARTFLDLATDHAAAFRGAGPRPAGGL